MRRFLLVPLLLVVWFAPAGADTKVPKLQAPALLELLKQPGHVAFMRHALAPFEGAPKSVPHAAEQLGPKDTQRNLDAVGRADAVRIGEAFRNAGVTFDFVYTSHVWRCVETAELIMQRPVENLPLINSFWADPDRNDRGTAQINYLKAFLNTTLSPTVRGLMVTHGSLITWLTDIDTDEAEMVIVKADGRGGIIVVARGIV